MICRVRRPIARQFEAERGTIRDAILTRAPEAKNSIFGKAFAECFVDHVSEALANDAWTPFLSWVDTTYHRHAESAPARAVFSVAPATVTEALRQLDEGGDAYEEFRSLAEAICTMTAVEDATSENADDVFEETDVAVGSIVSDLRALDVATADHSQAVSAWCGRIAERMGLPKTERVKVTRGGLIHDIGKTRTPKEILTAARPLTDDEWDVMREHVLAGERILQDAPLLRPFGSIVRSHHERYDGLGYPDGLDGSRIPITVRIVSVADSFNAMIGTRAYRVPMSPARAIDELKRCKGSQFDPNVVDVMIDVVQGALA